MVRTLILFSFSLCLCMFEARADKPYWQDLDVTSVNRQYPRTEFVTYSSREAALNRKFEKGEFYQSLNGKWKFLYVNGNKQLPENVESPKIDVSEWGEITVPGNWEVQGHGIAIYVNQPYEFKPYKPTPPLLPEENPVGVYRRDMNIDKAWMDNDIYLNIAGAKSGVYVYINGREVGYGENSKDMAQYLINDYINPGNNTLVLKIFRWSTGSYLECQDFWRISGIERDVYLSAQPKGSLYDFEVISTLDNKYQNGIFKLDIKRKEKEKNTSFSYQLLDRNGKVVANGSGGAEKTTYEATIPKVEKWSAEAPNLYTLVMEDDVNGVKSYIPFNVGFRRFEITDSQLKDENGKHYKVFLVNGQPIKFKGVNIHEHNEYTGHYVTEELMRKDLELMRLNNINAIRTSHYPQPRRFYELCDEIGIYVYSEANIESHGMYYNLSVTLANKREWLDAHMDRIVSMYERCKNYPCVTIWSLGNEAGNGYNFYNAYEWIEKREKGEGLMNRPICYERAQLEWNTDMIVPQYPGARWFERMGREGSDRPVMPSEYSHAMGNSNGSLWRQWKHIWKYPNLQGGYIWDWVDQGLVAYDEEGVMFWKYGGDYGKNMPSDANFLCNGIINPNRDPHPSMAEVKYCYSDIAFEPVDIEKGKYKVINRFYFTPLSEYDIKYTVEADGIAVSSGAYNLNTKPQDSEIITLPAIANIKNMDYYVKLEAITKKADRLIPKDYAIAADEFLVSRAKKEMYTEKAGGTIKVAETDKEIVISSSKFSFVFNKENCVATSYKVRGKEFFQDGYGMRINFWRGPTDNDYGNGAPLRQQVWKTAGKELKAQIKASTEGSGAKIDVDYTLPLGNHYVLTYHFYPSGIMNVETSYSAAPKDSPDLPRLGVRFRLPQSMEAFSYLGRGPQENYWDRKEGTFVGLYKTTASQEYYPYVRPQENGHHCDVAWIDLGKLYIVADDLMEFNILRNSIEDFDSEETVNRDYQWNNFNPEEINDPVKAKNILRRQTHINDIKPRNFVEVCLDYKQSGIAGYNSWGDRPEKEASLQSDKDYRWGFTIIPSSAVDGISRASKFKY